MKEHEFRPGDGIFCEGTLDIMIGVLGPDEKGLWTYYWTNIQGSKLTVSSCTTHPGPVDSALTIFRDGEIICKSRDKEDKEADALF